MQDGIGLINSTDSTKDTHLIESDPLYEDKLVEDLAAVIISRGLESPAVFLLEMYKPLSGLIINMTFIAYPLLNAVFGVKKHRQVIELFKNERAVEKLICTLEKTKVK